MARATAAVPRHRKKKRYMKAAKGYWRTLQALAHREERRRARLGLLVPGPEESQARLPSPLDRAHQRRDPRARPQLLALHQRTQAGGHRGEPEGPRRPGGPRAGRLRGPGHPGEGQAQLMQLGPASSRPESFRGYASARVPSRTKHVDVVDVVDMLTPST